MKSYTLQALLVLAIAFAGILSQHGRATWISALSVVPLALWVLALLFSAFIGPKR